MWREQGKSMRKTMRRLEKGGGEEGGEYAEGGGEEKWNEEAGEEEWKEGEGEETWEGEEEHVEEEETHEG